MTSQNIEHYTADEKWTILNSMFDELGLVRQHLDSYNLFIKHGLQQVVNEERFIHPDDERGMYVELEKITLGEPEIKEADGSASEIWPMDARTRNLTYAAPIHLKMTPRFPEGDENLINPNIRKTMGTSSTVVYIGHLPIMLRSERCRLTMNNPSDEVLIKHGEDPQDPGGYFIVNGSERVLVTQEDLAPNRILVERLVNKSSTSQAKVFSTMKGFRAPVTLERARDGSLRVSFPSVSRKISLITLLRALGLEKDGQIARRISSSDNVQAKLLPILQAETIRTQEQALDYIGKRVAVGQTKEYRVNRTEQVLDRYLLPHLGNEKEDRINKAYFLCLMAQRVLELEVNERQPDDKDHYASKRLNLAGDLLLLLFRNAFRSLTRDIKYQLERNANKRGAFLKTAVRADVITERLRHALATGNWVGGKAGVSQLLDRTNYMSALSHLRRVVSPLSRSQPHFEARDLHPTHWGKICVAPDTLVLLDDGITSLPIKNLETTYNSYKVITVEKDSHEEITSKIVDFQKISAFDMNKRVIKIETITGKSIKATEDHPFLTQRGWIDAGNLKITDKILYKPIINSSILFDEDERLVYQILDKDEFINGLWTSIISDEDKLRLEKDTVELEKLGLLPLDSDNEKLAILARLFGYIITDGSVSNTIEFYMGTESDAKLIQNDIEKLGFTSNPISLKETSLESDNNVTNYSTYLTTKGGSFKRLMQALGVPTGKRTEQDIDFPDWILNANKTVKREFIASFMGGDGSAPWSYKRAGRNDSFKIRIPDLEIHKSPNNINSQILFFEKMKKIFEEFGININNITTKKLSFDRVAIKLVFNSSKDNIKRLCDNIGYRYAKDKQNKSKLISEFLSYREIEIEKRKIDRENILELYSEGYQPKEISQTLGISYRVVTSTIQRREIPRNIVHPKSSLSVGQFFEETQANVNTGMLYLPIFSIKQVDVDIVYDFTTEKNTHSFIANGFVTHNCPNETPEGPNCGLVKNLALQAYISTHIDSSLVLQELLDLGMDQSPHRPDPSYARIFLNGSLVGFYQNGEQLSLKIRQGRRNRIFAPGVNVAYYKETNEVQINADQGRVRRPLIIVKDGIPALAKSHIEEVRTKQKRWSDLTRQGIIEYIDAEEEENCFIAVDVAELTPDHTHLEISPATILGICASLIPFPEHNRSDRNVYESGMAKQSLGLYAANFKLRLDTRSHILHYPQAPLVKTHGMAAIGFDQRPAGQNFVVGVLSYGGYNMEDALIMNKSSVDRGLGRSTFFRSYDAEERRYPGGQEDTFEIPSEEVRGFKAPEVYRHLSEDGVVEPETYVDGKNGDVIIGRTSPPRFLESQQEFDIPMERRRETSTAMRFGETGVVDTVVFTETQEGHRLIKVKVRSLRVPELGDKFASRHGQKGIVGTLVKQEDMPFSESGLSPDLIINPHAIPSRMTIGQLMELLAGKLASARGTMVTATAFEGMSADQIKEELHELGFQKYGREVMYDGRNGEKLISDVFVGIAFYQKLHHLVNDKIHARARGPVQILTRQPTEGRSREGGLKFGEMERDCLIGHGTALILKERLLDESDKSEALFCEKCGFIAQYNRRLEKMQCPVCREDTPVSAITISYAFKLLIQELMSLGIAPRVELSTKM